MAHDVFISYSTKDQKIVEGVSHFLEQNGIRCFVAYRDIPSGVVWAGAITEAIESCKMMIVVFSEHFNQSEQVDREIEMCSEEKKPILTFKIQNAAFNKVKKYYLKNINWIDAFPNPEECFGKLLESAKKLLPDQTTGEQIPAENQPVTKPLSDCLLKIRPNITCEVWIDGEKNTLANANQITKIPLNRGTFWLEFVSVENEQDKYSREYMIANPEELLSVDLESIAMERLEKERIAYLETVKLVSFKENGKYGYKVLGTNEIFIQAKYDSAYSFREGLASVKLDGKYGYIDKIGKEIIPLKYDLVESFSEGLARVKLDGKWEFIDKTGKEIAPLKYDYVDSFSEGLAWVKLDGKYGFIDKTGKEVIPLKYDDTYSFSEGLASVKLDGKYRFIDKTGKEVIPFKYDKANSFSDGFARVILNDEEFYIDKSGNRI